MALVFLLDAGGVKAQEEDGEHEKTADCGGLGFDERAHRSRTGTPAVGPSGTYQRSNKT